MNSFATVKAGVDLLEFILRETHVPIKRKMTNYVQLETCPFCGGHDCFAIHTGPESFFKCFQCDARGDVFSFASRRKGIDAGEALRYVAEYAGIPLPERPEARPRSTRQLIWERTAAHCHDALFAQRNAAPLDYLTGHRGHTRELLQKFGIGLTDGQLSRELEKTFSPDEIVASGVAVLRDGKLFDKWPPGYFVFPHKMTRRPGFGDIGDFSLKPYGERRYPLRLQTEFRDPGCLFLNHAALGSREIVIVEGQNDLLSVCAKGGFETVIATCGQLTNQQIDCIRQNAPGKTIYLCFDRDEAGRRYAEKVIDALKSELVPPRLREAIGGDETRLFTVEWFGDFKDIDDYLSAASEPESQFRKLLGSARPIYRSLKSCLALYQSHCTERKIRFESVETAKTQGEVIFEWLGGGDRFFIQKTGGNEPYLVFNHKPYALASENREFRALVYDVAGIVSAETRFNAIFDILECNALLKGRRIEVSPWLHVQNDSEIYLHVGRTDDAILRIAPGSVSVVPNAETCLLRPSNKMRPVEFDPNVNIRQAFGDFSSLFLQNLSTSPESRYFIAGWLFNVFLLGFSRDRAVLLFTGGAASGKTTAANLCSILLYGEDWVGKSKTASDYADGMVNPLTIKDNLESRDIDRQTLNYLLAAATGTVNQKRKGGTDSENTYERLNNQVLCTAIEPFETHELITRTWTVHFEGHHRSPAFQKTAVFERIKECRSRILSAFFILLSRDILPVYHDRRKFYLNHIRQCFPNHAKQRLDEFLSGLFVIIEALFRYLPGDGRTPPEHAVRALIDRIFQSQEQVARETEEQTNPVLFFLNELAKEFFFAESPKAFRNEFKVRLDETSLLPPQPAVLYLKTATSDLFGAFKYLAKKRGYTECFSTAQQLGARLSDSREILERSGWQIETRTVHGNRIYHLRKRRQSEDME